MIWGVSNAMHRVNLRAPMAINNIFQSTIKEVERNGLQQYAEENMSKRQTAAILMNELKCKCNVTLSHATCRSHMNVALET